MTTSASFGGTQSGRRHIQQHHSHIGLAPDASTAPAPPSSSRAGRIDAIVVPASRPVSFQRATIELAAEVGTRALLLCSGRVQADGVADLAAGIQGAQVLAVNIPDALQHDLLPNLTSDPVFTTAGAGRRSNLSLKRNVGLLMARWLGWRKILFLDDDITLGRSMVQSVRRLAAQLDRHQVVGMRCEAYPDNSVVCHARRLAGMPQDVFVTGAVLGVNCDGRPLPFFPDVYNEDWFFFSEFAAERALPRVGEAVQAEYDPFQEQRARSEEFGDLMAEGLYGLFDDQGPDLRFATRLAAASASFWKQFMDAREEEILKVRRELDAAGARRGGDEGRLGAALAALDASADQLSKINADLCVDFISAWQEDVSSWAGRSNRLHPVLASGDGLPVRAVAEVLDMLGLSEWRMAEFGNARPERTPMPFTISDRIAAGRPGRRGRAEVASLLL